jgi:hypothetical protein
MALDDFVMTIDSDAEDVAPTVSTSKSKAPDADDVALDANFDFDFADEFSATPFAQDEISRITLGTDRTVCSTSEACPSLVDASQVRCIH